MRRVAFLGLLMAVALSPLDAQDLPRTRLVLLGTGTPNADPERSGPATAVVVDGRVYLFDAGPGVVRRAAEAAAVHDIPGLRAPNLNRVFLTHLHSDHTTGLPDLMLGAWMLGRPEPLEVYGPPGTGRLTAGIESAWAADIDVRIRGLEPRDANRDAYRAEVREVRPGVAYEDELVRIEAFGVDHGEFDTPLGYKIVGPDRSIVISGDAAPSEAILEACAPCDVLLHEVYTADGLQNRPPAWQAYHSSVHTSTVELAEIANRVRPGLLVLYHQLMWGTDADGLVREIRAAGYSGPLASGKDLDVY